MGITSALGLVGLALLDSTSVGTLVVPLFLMVSSNFRASRTLLYLATISLFYFAVGLVLLFGSEAFVDRFGDALDSRPAYWVQATFGVAMFVASFFMDSGKKAEQRAAQGLPPEPSRSERRLSGNRATVAVVGVALLAGLLEVASMLPYIGAIAILTASDLPMVNRIAVLAGYVIVMIVPALLMLVIRLSLGQRAEKRLEKIRNWALRQTAASLPWIVGIIGFLIARDAIWRLGFFSPGLGS